MLSRAVREAVGGLNRQFLLFSRVLQVQSVINTILVIVVFVVVALLVGHRVKETCHITTNDLLSKIKELVPVLVLDSVLVADYPTRNKNTQQKQ